MMMVLTIWQFPSPYSAEAVVTRLHALCGSELIRLGDAALVIWPQGCEAPLRKPLNDLPQMGMLGAEGWGLLCRVLFPAAACDAGLDVGADGCGHGLAQFGLSAELLAATRQCVVEGTSALLLLIEPEVVRRLRHAFEGMGYTLIEGQSTVSTPPTKFPDGGD